MTAVTRVIEVPAHFDDRSFDQFAGGFGAWPPEEKLLVDARGAQWASPYGLIGMLTAGQALAEARRERPLLTVPTSDEVKRYWARAGFFRHAAELFELHGRVPEGGRDGTERRAARRDPGAGDRRTCTRWWRRSARRASRILHGELGLEMQGHACASVWRFPKRARILWSTPAPAAGWRCRRIPSGAGWAAAWSVIAVSDAGIGFRRSLESTHAKRFGERWGDGAALEAALIQGVSRFRDPGRGQGLAGIKRFPRPAGRARSRSGAGPPASRSCRRGTTTCRWPTTCRTFPEPRCRSSSPPRRPRAR